MNLADGLQAELIGGVHPQQRSNQLVQLFLGLLLLNDHILLQPAQHALRSDDDHVHDHAACTACTAFKMRW